MLNNTSTELTIIIPAKNEAANILTLLASVAKQDYLQSHKVPILVADAGSTDCTGLAASIAGMEFGLSVMVIPGGLPAVGRNRGAREAKSRYLLFLDADVVLEDPQFIGRVVGE